MKAFIINCLLVIIPCMYTITLWIYRWEIADYGLKILWYPAWLFVMGVIYLGSMVIYEGCKVVFNTTNR